MSPSFVSGTIIQPTMAVTPAMITGYHNPAKICAFIRSKIGDSYRPIAEAFGGGTRRLAAAAEAMRRILIDRARQRLAQRRGGRQEHVNIDDLDLAAPPDEARVIRVNDALEKFEVIEPEKAQLVTLRYFGGLTLEEAAQSLDINGRTARRWWDFARACLLRELNRS